MLSILKVPYERKADSSEDIVSLRRLIAFIALVAMTIAFIAMGLGRLMTWQLMIAYPFGLLMVRMIFYKIEMTSEVVVKVINAWRGVPQTVIPTQVITPPTGGV
jgi:fatty acid desaturase